MAITKFCLVLMAWGNKYTNRHINYIYKNVSQSGGLTQTLSITDRSYLHFEGKILKSGSSEELASDKQVRKLYLGKNFELRK